MTQKLTFVNGAKAACGCRHEFSSGGGEYSDVASVHLCAMHAGSPVLDDRWKARMLDGRAPERDEMGFGNHPELPSLDEGMMPRSFFAALGLELTHTSAEDQLDGDVLGAMSEAVNWTGWQPTPPLGDGWKLVSIFDTEDGPAAWWLRELPEAEDGTTTIRNLQAEVEKLEARIARLSRAGAAPAAVSPFGYVNTYTGQFLFDVEPCRKDNEGHWRTVYLQPAAVAPQGGYPPLPEHDASSIGIGLLWGRDKMHSYFDLGRQPATAAPAPEAPAAPVREVLTDGQITDALWRTHLRWMEQCGIDTEGMRPTGTWLEHWLIYARAVERASLAAAPQAPAVRAALSEGVILAVDKWFSQNTGLGGCSDKDAAELAAIFAAAPQAPNCTRCSGSGEDPEGYLTHGRGPDDHTVDGPCRECDGTGAAPPAPAAPGADERAAYVEFLAGKFPQTYSKEDAEHWWDHGHVSALTWQAARAVAVAPAAPAVDAELLELAQAIVKFNREHGSVLAVHIDNLAELVDERAAQAAAKGEHDE